MTTIQVICTASVLFLIFAAGFIIDFEWEKSVTQRHQQEVFTRVSEQWVKFVLVSIILTLALLCAHASIPELLAPAAFGSGVLLSLMIVKIVNAYKPTLCKWSAYM